MPRALLALVGAGSRTTPDQRANLQLSNASAGLVPQVRAPSYNVRGSLLCFWGANLGRGFLKPSENLELLGKPRLARLRLRGTWGTRHQAVSRARQSSKLQ